MVSESELDTAVENELSRGVSEFDGMLACGIVSDAFAILRTNRNFEWQLVRDGLRDRLSFYFPQTTHRPYTV